MSAIGRERANARMPMSGPVALRYRYLHHIAGFEPDGRVETGAGTGGGAGEDHVAGGEVCEGGQIVDLILDRVFHRGGCVVLAQFAVDGGGEVQIIEGADLADGHEPGPECAARLPVLSLGDVEFRVADPVADRALVAEGETGYVAAGILDGDAAPRLADDDDDLAFVVELRRFGRTDEIAVVAGEAVGPARKDAGVGGVGLVDVLRGPAFVVDTYAEDLPGPGEKAFEGDLGEGVISRGSTAHRQRFTDPIGGDDVV